MAMFRVPNGRVEIDTLCSLPGIAVDEKSFSDDRNNDEDSSDKTLELVTNEL